MKSGAISSRVSMRVAVLFAAAGLVSFSQLTRAQGTESAIAIVRATLIDGNGGAPVPDATILIQGKEIVAVGPRTSVRVPANSRIIDGTGKFATPGIIDTNVHLAPLGGETSFARYWDRAEEIVLRASQLHLKYGVTTVRDSYGPLIPLMAVRDAIAAGKKIGPRMFVAGNIVGWGGPFSDTMSRTQESTLDLFKEQINDAFTLGAGEELIHMTSEELRVAMNNYLDRGPDFIKYGGTSHVAYPALIAFSPRAQKVIVDETHKRGLVAETHSGTLEGLWLSLNAGIDLIQHPEVIGYRELTDELLDLIVKRRIICSMLTNGYTGKNFSRLSGEKQEQSKAETERRVPKTSAEIRREILSTGKRQVGSMLVPGLEMVRTNFKKLMTRGAILSVGADTDVGFAPEFRRTDYPEHREPGIGTIIAIEGFVELGMTPAQALVAATKNGAMACKALDKFGTLEVGKIADILLLAADPLADISNIRKLDMVMKEGQVIDLARLPSTPMYREW